MKKLFFIAVLMGCAISTTAQVKENSDILTSISFDSRTIDYGTITKGSDGVRSFVFQNTGLHPLKIYRIYSSCSCDILSQPQQAIAPGDSGEIKVTYDTKKLGPIVKTITVYANIEDKMIPLRLKGKVVEKE